MEEDAVLADFKRYSLQELKSYLGDRKVRAEGKQNELAVLAFWVWKLKIPINPSEKQTQKLAEERLHKILEVHDGLKLPHPDDIPDGEWTKDLKCLPQLEYGHLYDYLMNTPGRGMMTTLDTLGEEAEISSDESLEEEIDFNPTQAESNKFDTLCDGLMSSLALVRTSLSEFLFLKDELMQHSLPPPLLARLTMVTGRIFRSTTDLHCPASELVRLVRVYSSSWEAKSAALKKLHSDYDSKHKQLNVAIRRLQLIDAQARRMAKERRIMMWEKLFSKLTSARGHGRRWKFLIDNFKQKSKLGMEHLQTYIDSLDRESDSEPEEGADTAGTQEEGATLEETKRAVSGLSDSVNELQTISSSDEELDFSEESSYEYSGDETPGGVKRVTFGESTDGPSSDSGADKNVYVEVPAPKPPTAERGVWTHEPQYDYYLNVRVHQPLGIQGPDLKCSLTFQQQFMKTEVFNEEKPGSRGKSESAPVTGKRSTLIGSKERANNSRQKKRSSSRPSDKCFTLMFPIGDKPLFDMADEASPPSESSSKLDDKEDDRTIKLGVHQGDINELVAMGTVGYEDLKSLDIHLVESPEDTEPLAPMPFPIYKVPSGKKFNQEDGPPIKLPLLFYYTRVLKPYTKECQTESESVNEIVFDLTGVDLNILKKADLSINKEYKERCLSAMSVKSSQSEKESVVPRSDLELLMTQHEEEIKMIHEEYQDRIHELTGSLEELQNDQINALLNPRARTTGDREIHKTGGFDYNAILLPGLDVKCDFPSQDHFSQRLEGGGGDKKVTGEKPVSQVKKFKTSPSVPKWGSELPNDFLDRLQQFSEESQKKQQELTEKTRREVEQRLEKQLAVQYRLSVPDGDRRATLKDVSIPAVFMPSRTGQIYSPRAHQYFHSTGSLGQLRLTQPPSIFQLPPLPPRTGISVLNLFDIKRNFAFPEDRDTDQSRATTVMSSRAGASSQQAMTPSSRHTTVTISD